MEPLELVDSVPGWLLPEDAEKLYELAGSTSGPILEIGTYHGKSAILMALALQEAQRDTVLFTLDVDRNALKAAAEQAHGRGVGDLIVFVRGTVNAFARANPHVRPALTFLDADHSRAAVQRDLSVLHTVVPEGGLLLFHDFNDRLNDDPACAEIKVRPTVQASWVARECRFEGVFGACGLFTRTQPPPQNGAISADLLRLDNIKDQYDHRLRYPAGRLWRRIRPRRPN